MASRTLSIRAKSLLLGLGYLVALSGIYGAFTLYLLRLGVTDVSERLEQTARIVASELDAAITAGSDRLQTIARLPGLAYGLDTIQAARGDGYIPPWTTLHYLFFRSRVFTGGVFLLDRGGQVLWTEPPGRPWARQSLRDVPPVAATYQEGRGQISGLLRDDLLASAPHVIVTAPIRNDVGELQGVLGGVVDLTASEFREPLRAVATTQGRFARVVDQDGVVLASTNALDLYQPPAAAPAGEEPMLSASVALTAAPWRVVTGQPRALGLATIWRSQRVLWVTGLALLLIAAAAAAPAVNRFVRSLQQLTAAAETVTRGDLSQPVRLPAHRDELGTLARAFEQMRVELENSRRVLEQRLHEREDLINKLTHSYDELRATQARLIEAERFAAIGELSAAVAHGIRNPVAGIKAAAQFASVELPPEHPCHENVADIIGEADKLEARISALLDFTRPFEPKRSPCRIDDLVAEAAASLRSRLATQGIDLTTDIEPGMPPMELDDAQIEQVLLALLSNASDATSAGGRVQVRARVNEARQRLQIEVSDTGSGIPANRLERIFNLFFTTKATGTGFGLAVAKRIVEHHGGTIEVESMVGVGTTFRIELPI